MPRRRTGGGASDYKGRRSRSRSSDSSQQPAIPERSVVEWKDEYARRTLAAPRSKLGLCRELSHLAIFEEVERQHNPVVQLAVGLKLDSLRFYCLWCATLGRHDLPEAVDLRVDRHQSISRNEAITAVERRGFPQSASLVRHGAEWRLVGAWRR